MTRPIDDYSGNLDSTTDPDAWMNYKPETFEDFVKQNTPPADKKEENGSER